MGEELRALAASSLQEELQRLKRSCSDQRALLHSQVEKLRVEASRLLVEQARVPATPSSPLFGRFASHGALALQAPVGSPNAAILSAASGALGAQRLSPSPLLRILEERRAAAAIASIASEAQQLPRLLPAVSSGQGRLAQPSAFAEGSAEAQRGLLVTLPEASELVYPDIASPTSPTNLPRSMAPQRSVNTTGGGGHAVASVGRDETPAEKSISVTSPTGSVQLPVLDMARVSRRSGPLRLDSIGASAAASPGTLVVPGAVSEVEGLTNRTEISLDLGSLAYSRTEDTLGHLATLAASTPSGAGTGGEAKASCPACGNEYLPDAIFCRKCGQKRTGYKPEAASAGDPAAPSGESEEPPAAKASFGRVIDLKAALRRDPVEASGSNEEAASDSLAVSGTASAGGSSPGRSQSATAAAAAAEAKAALQVTALPASSPRSDASGRSPGPSPRRHLPRPSIDEADANTARRCTQDFLMSVLISELPGRPAEEASQPPQPTAEPPAAASSARSGSADSAGNAGAADSAGSAGSADSAGASGAAAVTGSIGIPGVVRIPGIESLVSGSAGREEEKSAVRSAGGEVAEDTDGGGGEGAAEGTPNVSQGEMTPLSALKKAHPRDDMWLCPGVEEPAMPV